MSKPVKRQAAWTHSATPRSPWRCRIEGMVAEGDLVSVRTRWTGRYSSVLQGVTITGRPVTPTVENWADYNRLDLDRQLGFIVAAPAGPKN